LYILTWVPDWTTPNICNEIWAAATNACSMPKAEAKYAGDGILGVTGTCLATLKQVENTLRTKFLTKSPKDRYLNVIEATQGVATPVFGVTSLSKGW
jgi:hypothetical protein